MFISAICPQLIIENPWNGWNALLKAVLVDILLIARKGFAVFIPASGRVFFILIQLHHFPGVRPELFGIIPVAYRRTDDNAAVGHNALCRMTCAEIACMNMMGLVSHAVAVMKNARQPNTMYRTSLSPWAHRCAGSAVNPRFWAALLRPSGVDFDLAEACVQHRSQQKNFFSHSRLHMCLPISSNLLRMVLAQDTGTKSGRCITLGTWWEAMLVQWLIPVAQCL